MLWHRLIVLLCIAAMVWPLSAAFAQEDEAEYSQQVVEATIHSFDREAVAQLIQIPAPVTESVLGQQPSPEEINIFDRIDIDVEDLQQLRETVETRLSGDKIRLSLDEAIRMALESNQDILISEFEPLRAEADIRSAWGEFDPVASASATYNESTTSLSAQSVVFGGIAATDSFSTNTELSVGGVLPWGTQYNVALNIDKEESTFNRFIEEFSGGASVTLTQPLLRGLGLGTNLARVRISRFNEEIAISQLRLTLLNVVADVIRAYWDVVGAIETLRVRRESLANAERLLDINEKRLEIGTAARIDVLQAKAGLATRSSDVITARVALADAEDRLKQLLDMREGDLFSPAQVVPVDRPNVVQVDLDESRSMELARKYRPEITSQELEILSSEADQRRARNDLLPQLDASVTYFQGARDHKLRQVLRGIQNNDDDSLTVSLQGSIPLGNRAARGAYQRAKLTTRLAEQRLKKARLDVDFAVRASIRSVNASQALVESNQQARLLQEANVAAEEEKLRLGTTTSQNVLDIEEDLIAAETAEVQATIDYEKALIDLQVAEGTLLSNLGIEFESDEDVPPISYWKSLWPFWQDQLVDTTGPFDEPEDVPEDAEIPLTIENW